MPVYIELSNGGFAAGFYPWELGEEPAVMWKNKTIPLKGSEFEEIE